MLSGIFILTVHGGLGVDYTDGTLFFWNTTTSLVEKSVKEHMNAICGVSWSPNGSQIFSADKDRVVCMWGSSSGST
ncbi:hypothetical protein BC936DRAFT_146270 [Jimgerdemannia flammicorona]|uniref:Uncharacterized protein n=1 Tax=Jimgerdemannia flammicorona TaxID=994334 RepID=A0A433DLJ5_9FUNG|nr:hypothetical protein BC936DRAFT_146270 [Jimgerdemannia flammicorona]